MLCYPHIPELCTVDYQTYLSTELSFMLEYTTNNE